MSKCYKKNIIFSKSNLSGHYRYKNEFQIYPLDIEKAPKSKVVNHLPCCFEFCYEDKEVEYFNPFGNKEFDKMLSETAAESNKRNRILNLLSTITNYRFHLKGRTDCIWTMQVPEEVTDLNRDDINNSVSSPSIEMYYYPGIGDNLKISEFSNIEFNNVLYMPHKNYYMFDPVDGRDKTVKFPVSIDEILDKYYKLDKTNTIVIDSAAYQICNALDLQSSMKSLSFFSAVSAIETMVNLEYKDEKIEFECNECKSIKSSTRICKKCGKPKWGIAEKFREFLGNYVSSTKNSRRKFNKIYSVRSKIAHTEFLLFNENILDWNFTDKSNDLYMQLLEAIQLGRLSIVNWLLKN